MEKVNTQKLIGGSTACIKITILRNKDVKRFIQKFIPTMKTNCQDILQLSNLQFNQLQTQLEKQCKDSEENQEELCFLLSTILSFVEKTNEKINTCIKN